MKAEILEEVKKEIEKMLNAGFIRPSRYAEWISSIVPVEKKDGRWRVAIDFRDLNRATPKDEYPMPVAETLINAAAGHKPAKAVKGQALADLIAERINTDIAALSVRAWAMFFDGSVCDNGCGIGILLVSPRGPTYSFSIRLPTPCTNNVAEYEAICKGMELLLEAGAEAVELFGDSKLVISQLTEEYKCESESLFPLWMQCRELMAQFKYINFNWIPRSQNAEANDLAQMASGYKDVADGADIRFVHGAG
ncbi:hypothetical protein QYE76_031620 [Lolium multiflorum]|uniref:RNase H type-1 domain-containing protein n=1 Tax=Lolium multiflorum TaxID=4521 RepID=A0AAD8QUC5_LOLMU|nr:hypothetical protein QYE76_031620 [Lolium multiflorum]